MKKDLLKKLKKSTSIMLAAAMLISGIPVNAMADANGNDAEGVPDMAAEQVWTEEHVLAEEADNLENIASQCMVQVPSFQAGKPAENMVDGSTETLWVNNGAAWPCEMEFKLPAANTKCVKKVVLKLEAGKTDWGMDVSLKYALNNVTSDKITVSGSQKTIKFEDGYSFEFEVPQAMTHLYITLDNPTNAGAAGAFWPAVAEAEIYIDQDAEEVIELENIAKTTASDVVLDESVNGSADKGALTDEDENTAAALHTKPISGLDASSLPFAEVQFGIDQKMRSFVIAMAQDGDANHYLYTLYGKKCGSDAYEQLTAGEIGTSASDYKQEIAVSDFREAEKEVEYESVKIVFDGKDAASKDTIPSLAEFQILANKATIAAMDKGNIAWNKKNLHSNYSQSTVSSVVDGNKDSAWTAAQYPAYVDIDLEALYELSEIQVFTPAEGYSQYSLYVSEDGRDFKKAAEKTGKESCTSEGESYSLDHVKASVVRILLEYNSKSEKAVLNEIRILGERIGDETKAEFTAPQGFEDSAYNVQVTQQDTIEEVQGIISRNVGDEYIDWFEFQIGESQEHDYFEIQDSEDGKVLITGNDGISLAMGLNHYLKYYCNASITQVGNQVHMPDQIVSVGQKVHKEAKVDVRYAYNYCTMSYSMPFWGESEWRKELDWLALNGVNLVLDITGQEEVWREFLSELGYDHASIKDFIAGPAYYAWAYMANLSGYGGPVHDSWFEERTELARKNHLIMQKLGMQPVLQGYSGMLPNNILDYAKGEYALTEADIIRQGTWCSFQRPDMLVTTSAAYGKYAELFYSSQRNVMGDVSNYYAADPFHEGGNTGSMNVSDVSDYIMRSMLAENPDAVWVIQAWQGNPRASLLEGLNKQGGTDYRDHALVLDLYAEKTPWWSNMDSSGDRPYNEFNQTPWVYCMLNNFGGRMGLHGHMDNLVDGVVKAANTSNKLSGIGITPEGSQNNPVLYDLLFETIWCDDASKDLQKIDTSEWLKDYATRRYGAESENAYQAMLILENTVYKAKLNMLGQGAPESYINARPAESIGAASTWGNATISYDMEELEKAASLLLEDYDKLKDSDGYQYDLADILKQILSNASQKYHREMVTALKGGSLEEFEKASDKFLNLIDETDKVLGTREEFLVGTWVEQAIALGTNADEFSKDLYEFNAKALVTTWGAYPQAESGGLKDYSNRQWAGLTRDFYKERWSMWIEYNKEVLAGNTPQPINWFEFEWAWARANTKYETQASGENLKTLGQEVLSDYSSVVHNPAADDSHDYPVGKLKASSLNYEDQDGNRPADVLDNDVTTMWHTKWGATTRENHYIVLELEDETEVTGLRYLPRSSGANGIITKYEVYVSSTGEEGSYQKAAEGSWLNDTLWKMASFEPVKAKYVKLVSVESTSGEEGCYYSSAAELRVTVPGEKPPVLATSISLGDKEAELVEGESLQLKAEVLPADASQEVSYESDNPDKATVDASGKVYAVAPGEAEITATTLDGGKLNASVKVTVVAAVKPPVLAMSISLGDKEAELVEGRSLQLKAEVLPADASQEVSYESDSPDKATVDASGKVYAVAPGEAEITATTLDGSKLNASVKVTVVRDEEKLVEEQRSKLEELLNRYGDLKETSYTTASWNVYKAARDTAVAAAKKEQVTADELAQSYTDLEQAYARLQKRADTSALKAEMDKASALKESDYTADSWKKFKAVLDEARKLLADTNLSDQSKAAQMAAALKNAVGSLQKKPAPVPAPVVKVKKITLKTSTKKLAAGKKAAVKAVVSPSNAKNKSLSYKSSNTKYAVVNSKGIVTAKKAGAGKSVTITVTARDGSRVKRSVRIKIYKYPVKRITLKASSKTVKAGRSIKLKTTVTPSKNVNKSLSFKSSNMKYATVNSKGLVKTKKAGRGKTVRITAAATDGSKKKDVIKLKIK